MTQSCEIIQTKTAPLFLTMLLFFLIKVSQIMSEYEKGVLSCLIINNKKSQSKLVPTSPSVSYESILIIKTEVF